MCLCVSRPSYSKSLSLFAAFPFKVYWIMESQWHDKSTWQRVEKSRQRKPRFAQFTVLKSKKIPGTGRAFCNLAAFAIIFYGFENKRRFLFDFCIKNDRSDVRHCQVFNLHCSTRIYFSRSQYSLACQKGQKCYAYEGLYFSDKFI